MLSYVLAVIIFAGLGAVAFYGYKTSMEMADRMAERRASAPSPEPSPALVVEAPIES